MHWGIPAASRQGIISSERRTIWRHNNVIQHEHNGWHTATWQVRRSLEHVYTRTCTLASACGAKSAAGEDCGRSCWTSHYDVLSPLFVMYFVNQYSKQRQFVSIAFKLMVPWLYINILASLQPSGRGWEICPVHPVTCHAQTHGGHHLRVRPGWTGRQHWGQAVVGL